MLKLLDDSYRIDNDFLAYIATMLKADNDKLGPRETEGLIILKNIIKQDTAAGRLYYRQMFFHHHTQTCLWD